VTGAVVRPTGTDLRLAEAATGYRRYVGSQLDALRSRTEEFADAVEAGDVDRAKALYPVTRTYWERVEPVAESFPDLDIRIDGREDDGRDPGVAWTGFHRLEKDLWVDGLRPDSAMIADQLVTDVTDVRTRVASLGLEPPELGKSARELLDEVNTRKIRGEENRYSHTDLWDVTANVEGARTAVAALRPVIDEKDASMGAVLDERFDDLEALLKRYRSGDGYESYTSLAPDDIKSMTDAIDALAEEVSYVAAVVTS
jgi:iron uptake system component EfeO